MKRNQYKNDYTEEQKQHLIDIMKADEELGLYEETKCYCGHTTYCDCGPEESKQETLEEAGVAYAKTVNQNHTSHMLGFHNGAKWQQQNSYSEEDLRKAYMVGKHGGTTQTYYDFKELLEIYKKEKDL